MGSGRSTPLFAGGSRPLPVRDRQSVDDDRFRVLAAQGIRSISLRRRPTGMTASASAPASESASPRQLPSCRFCALPSRDTFVDLGMSPLCETFPSAAALNRMEPFYPLHVWVCRDCMLVQLEEYVAPEVIFDDSTPTSRPTRTVGSITPAATST